MRNVITVESAEMLPSVREAFPHLTPALPDQVLPTDVVHAHASRPAAAGSLSARSRQLRGNRAQRRSEARRPA